MLNIKQDHITIGKRRSGIKMLKPLFIVAHDTGNLDSTAQNNVNYYKNTFNETSTSAHAFVDDKGVIECVPKDEKAWHVRYDIPLDNTKYGDDANDASFGIELCYFKDIVRSKKAYENYVAYIAGLMAQYELTIDKVIGHFQLDPTRRTDPINAFKTFGKTWDGFILDLQEASKESLPVTTGTLLKEATLKELVNELQSRV